MKFGKLIGTYTEKLIQDSKDKQDAPDLSDYSHLTGQNLDSTLDEIGDSLQKYLESASQEQETSDFYDDVDTDQYSKNLSLLRREAFCVFTGAIRRHFNPKRFDASVSPSSRPWETKLRKLGYSCVEHLMHILESQWQLGFSWENFGTEWTIRPLITTPSAPITKFADKPMREMFGPDNIAAMPYHRLTCKIQEPHIKFQPHTMYHVHEHYKYKVTMPKGWEKPLCIEMAERKRIERQKRKEMEKLNYAG